jgi:hypothetical protein
MQWIIQSNIFREDAYDDLLDTFKSANIPFIELRVIPFSHELDPVPQVENPIAVYGSTTLVRIAKKYGWGPGVFWDEELNFQTWLPHWGEHLLNYDAEVVRFEDIKFTGKKFIRPVDDLKLFAGMVVDSDNFTEWQDKVVMYDDGMVTKNTLCVVSDTKTIVREYRFFVVDGKVVTGSQYKLGNRLYFKTLDPSWFEWVYVQRKVDQWQPDRGFVIDIAELSDKSFKIIEVNNLNSSGFYACDVSKIIQAVDAIE